MLSREEFQFRVVSEQLCCEAAEKKPRAMPAELHKVTETFPEKEVFGLTIQMRRCVISITSNIAEGFSRQSYKEKTQFYFMALGSITELQNQLLVARDVGYLDKVTFQPLAEQSVKVHKITNGLIKKSKILIHDS